VDRVRAVIALLVITGFSASGQQLELSRDAHPWEFFDAIGQKAAVFGHENGTVEAWVYPLKLIRDFHLVFHFDTRSVAAEHYVRTFTIRPEGAEITYRGDSFRVRQTFVVPPDQPGGIMLLEIDTFEPFEIEAVFERDFQLMWPASIGATYMNWDAKLRAYTFGEESKQYFGVIGSPTAQPGFRERADNNAAFFPTSFRLGKTTGRMDRKLIVFAGSVKSNEEMTRTYQLLSPDPDATIQASSKYYSDYLDRTVQLQLPDPVLQRAYDWARVSTVQGLVTNPLLGSGLIAGYRTSGNDWRPGFAWFFGRDSLWTDLALNSVGDFSTTRTALDFITKLQRADGKIPHELSQSGSLLPWFEKYPWGWAAADATPLYIITLDDYVHASGDREYAHSHWENAWKAYQFMRSTYDDKGFAKNIGVGHGWIEGGPLLPVKSEHYLVGLQLQALRSLARLADLAGKQDIHKQLEVEYAQKRSQADEMFWSPVKNSYIYAVDVKDQPMPTVSVLSTVPMWFEVTDPERSNKTIDILAQPDHHAQWGMRILSDKDPRYDPTGYHFGSIWPLFTGWASVGEYKYHRADAAYANLRANALLTENGPLGRVTEVMSGTFHEQLATSSPHQIWSSAMVISPIMRGMFGIQSDQLNRTLSFMPHLPEGWKQFKILNLPACGGQLALSYSAAPKGMELKVDRTGGGRCAFTFSPVAALGNTRVLVNGNRVSAATEKTLADTHLRVTTELNEGTTTINISFP
jgi:glycogen debranching enzyme